MAQLEAAQAAADEQARAESEKRADELAIAQRERALAAREQAQQDVIARRENMMAFAALLLAVAAVAAGGAVLDHSKGETKRARLLGGGAGLLLLAAVVAFALRPGFASSDAAPADNAANVAEGSKVAASLSAPAGVGENLCRIDSNLSRVTVSDTADVPFSWTAGGCLNGQTQFALTEGRWTRILVPADEASVSIRNFDPATGRYRADKYLIDAQTAERVRELRQKVQWSGCTADPQRIAELARMQSDIKAMLPAMPNERLAYRCEGRKTPPGP